MEFDGDLPATVTDEPLPWVPRLLGVTLVVAPYADRFERHDFGVRTFGSEDFLWDDPDYVRFDKADRSLVGVELRMPEEAATAEESARLPVGPAVLPGGLRADEVRDFGQRPGTVLCRAPGDEVLTVLRDPAVLDAPLDARVGIATDVALLVQGGRVVGWSLTDPARYVTAGYEAPEPDQPSDATRRLFTDCLDFVTTPLVEDLIDGEQAALRKLRVTERALRSRTEDPLRTRTLLALIATSVDAYGDW